MTDKKKHDDKDRKKLSDEEMEDVAGGVESSSLFDSKTFSDFVLAPGATVNAKNDGGDGKLSTREKRAGK
jgi:hypothetical protein